MPRRIDTKWFIGTEDHLFRYTRLHDAEGTRVSYGGTTFDSKQDAKRNLNRMLREYRDHEMIEGQNRDILQELAERAFPGSVNEQTLFAKVEDWVLQVYFLDANRRHVGCCFADDLISAM